LVLAVLVVFLLVKALPGLIQFFLLLLLLAAAVEVLTRAEPEYPVVRAVVGLEMALAVAVQAVQETPHQHRLRKEILEELAQTKLAVVAAARTQLEATVTVEVVVALLAGLVAQALHQAYPAQVLLMLVAVEVVQPQRELAEQVAQAVVAQVLTLHRQQQEQLIAAAGAVAQEIIPEQAQLAVQA
jgi:hypothetical protein